MQKLDDNRNTRRFRICLILSAANHEICEINNVTYCTIIIVTLSRSCYTLPACELHVSCALLLLLQLPFPVDLSNGPPLFFHCQASQRCLLNPEDNNKRFIKFSIHIISGYNNMRDIYNLLGKIVSTNFNPAQ